jgi:hypothetical protein
MLRRSQPIFRLFTHILINTIEAPNRSVKKGALYCSKEEMGMKTFIKWLLSLVLVGSLGLAAYTWIMLNWSYGSGDRAGYVQKFSNRGYVCKTWEGELAMVSMPGTMSEKFFFTVHDLAVVQKINANLGKKVALKYDQHIGLPSSCFGDTEYFVSDVTVLEQ